MKNCVYYYQLHQQFFGTRYLGEYAREFASLMGFKYQEIYFAKQSELIKNKKLYLPDVIMVNDIKIVESCTAEELYIIYHLRDSLAGQEKYKQMPIREADIIRPFNANIEGVADICTSGMMRSNLERKIAWLKKQSRITYNNNGFIAYKKGEPVALLEFINEKSCIYPLEKKRKNYLFITCLANFPNQFYDYRPCLFKELINFANNHGYQGLTVICGNKTTNPNGPVKFFQDLDFTILNYLDQVFLKYSREDIYLMEYKLG